MYNLFVYETAHRHVTVRSFFLSLPSPSVNSEYTTDRSKKETRVAMCENHAVCTCAVGTV